jgi:PrtD family type I secretion system ABC transporter
MINFYWIFIKKYQKFFKSIIIFSFFINILVLVPAWFMLQVFDRVLTSYDDNTLFGLGLIFTFLMFIYFILEKYRRLSLTEAGKIIFEEYDNKINEILINDRSVNSRIIIEVQNHVEVIKNFISNQYIIALIDAPWVIIFVLAMFILHPILGIISIISIFLIIFLSLNGMNIIKKFKLNLNRINQKKLFNLQSVDQDLQTYHVMGSKENVLSLINKNKIYQMQFEDQISQTATTISLRSKFFRIFIQSFILAVAAYLAIKGEATLGIIIASTIILSRCLSPLDLLINNLDQLKKFEQSYTILNQIIKQFNAKHTKKIKINYLDGKIILKNVFFSYPKQEEFIQNFNLIIQPGECLGIVGKSGSGKTTLLKLLGGVLEPTRGHIYYDNNSLNEIDWSQSDNIIGYLSQQPNLMEGTIADNISGFSSKNLDRIKEISKLINIDEEINLLKDKYDQLVGSGGLGLSFGQIKQIAIARTIYKDPKIVLLDEPSLGLDNNSLKNLINLIQHLKNEKKTIIFTSHASNLLLLANKVMVLEKGKVISFDKTEKIIKKIN